MPRIRCPECDNTVKIDKDDERPSVRCDECGYKIRIDDEGDSRNGSTKKKTLERKKKKGDLQSAVVKNWVQFVPVAIIIPISFLILALALFAEVGAMLAILFGFLVSMGAFIWASVLIFKHGHYVSIDYLDSLGPLKWILIFGFLGLYLMGYIALLFVAQVMTVIRKPMVMGPWMFLQAYGVLLMIAGPVAYGVGFARPRQPDFAQLNPQIPPPNPNPVVNPVNPQFNPNKGKEEEPFNPLPKKKIEEPVQPPPRVTGDEALDKVLADLGNQKDLRKAAENLARMQPNQHRPAVAKALANQLQIAQIFDRTAILTAMRVWATPEEVPLLLQLLGDQDINTRNEVMQVLGKVKDARAAAPMARCLQELQTQYHAEHSLIAMGPVAERELWPLLNQKQPDVRSVVVRILAVIGTPQSIPALQAAAQDFTLQGSARAAIQAIQARGQK